MSRNTAADDSTEVATDGGENSAARRPPVEYDGEHPDDAVDELEKGDEVVVRYRAHSGDEGEEAGAVEKKTGSVSKVIDGAAGGVWVTKEQSHRRDLTLKLHTVPGATVTGNVPYGSRTKRYGVDARVELVDDEDDEPEYVDRMVECRECGKSSTRTVHRVYDDGDATLLDCGRCGEETGHDVGAQLATDGGREPGEQIGAAADRATDPRGSIDEHVDLRVTATLPALDDETVTFTTTVVAVEDDDTYSYDGRYVRLTCEGASDAFIDLTGTECHDLSATFDADDAVERVGGSYVSGKDESGRLLYDEFEVESVELVDD